MGLSPRGILATRGRKIGAAIGAAILASVGAGIAAWILNGAESATKNVLGGSGGAPLVVHVARPDTFTSAHAFAPYYVVPGSQVSSPTELPAEELKGDEPFDFTFAERHGGIAGSPEIVQLRLSASGDEPVTINAIRIKVVRRASPVQGWYAVAPGCGGSLIRIADIDLDKPSAPIRFFAKGSEQKQLALFVTRTDVEVIQLWARTRTALVDWTAEVFYSGPKGDGSVTVDDNGRPFRVTTETASEGYQLAFTGGQKVQRMPDWDKTGIVAC